MPRTLSSLIACLALVAFPGCQPAGQDPAQEPAETAADEVETAFSAARDAYVAAETIEDKVGIARDFLLRYPESEMTVDVVKQVIEDAAGEAGRPELAYPVVDAVLAKIGDPEIRFKVRRNLLGLHGMAGKQDPLRALAAELAAERPLRYMDHYSILEAAAEAGCWDLLLAHGDASLAFANLEDYQQDNPDESAAEAARGAVRRRVYSLAYKGWALENLGRTDEALAAFRRASEDRVDNLLGIDKAPVDLYWAKTLLRLGDPAAAMELLAAETAFGWEEEWHATYREAYVAHHGSDEGLDDHRRELRARHGREVPDFALANYEGQTVRFHDLRGELVVLTLWDPG